MLIKKEFEDASSVFISTDVHGHRSGLETSLMIAGYQENRGHSIVLVGDNINGGPESGKMIKFLEKDNVFSVMGNHESYVLNLAKSINEKDFKIVRRYLRGQTSHVDLQSAFNSKENQTDNPKQNHIRDKICSWVHNGGSWFFLNKYHKQMDSIKKLQALSLPVAMELHFPEAVIGIVHGDVHERDWNSLAGKISHKAKYAALWGREYVTMGREKEGEGITPIRNIDVVVLGHTRLGSKPVVVGNCCCMDVGAKRSGRPAVMTAREIINLVQEKMSQQM
jgi:predicted phosphodiesterase